MWTLVAVLVACVLDWILGDPPKVPHIVVYIGKLISVTEKGLRSVFGATPRGEFVAGIVLVVVVAVVPTAIVAIVLWLLGLIHPAVRMVAEALVCWQCLALTSLKQASERVEEALGVSLEEGRKYVGYIVGRDTTQLSEAEVIDATVETVAENTSDGVVAPLLCMMIGGAPLAVLYKAINTMDSMVGYITPPYTHFGTAAARTDDVANWIPARLTGLAMVLAAAPAGLNVTGAWRIFKRDRNRHRSPNSGQTEAACAGALGLQLGGDHIYFGEVVSKPTIGDATRPPERHDIDRANRLMIWTSAICLLAFTIVRLIVIAVML